MVPSIVWLRADVLSSLVVVAVPVVASIGFAGLRSQTALLIATFLAGFCVLGVQSGINVAGALIYPTSLRANGSGWELGIGRIGSIVGPLMGALFVGLPVERLYMWSALPFAVGAIVVAADGTALATGYSREISPHNHAEEAALAKLAPGDPRLDGATLFSSLEPCRAPLVE